MKKASEPAPTLYEEMTALVAKYAASMDSAHAPDSETEEGDVVVGDLPKSLRPLYMAMCEVHKEANAWRMATVKKIPCVCPTCIGKTPKPELASIAQQFAVLVNKDEYFETVFWNSVRHAFPERILDLKNGVGIRKGWKVVKPAPEPGPRVQVIDLGVVSLPFGLGR